MQHHFRKISILLKVRNEKKTHVIPPIATLYTIARGVSLAGWGISSLICVAASLPINESADCIIPSMQAIPEPHPVVFSKFVKTNVALVFLEVARSTMLMAKRLPSDQKTVNTFRIILQKNGGVTYELHY